MDFNVILTDNTDDWIFNSLQIENFSEWSNSRLRHWFYHVCENQDKRDGDIFEFGVYVGGGAIAMGLLLKKLGSDKKIAHLIVSQVFQNITQMMIYQCLETS